MCLPKLLNSLIGTLNYQIDIILLNLRFHKYRHISCHKIKFSLLILSEIKMVCMLLPQPILPGGRIEKKRIGLTCEEIQFLITGLLYLSPFSVTIKKCLGMVLYNEKRFI